MKRVAVYFLLAVLLNSFISATPTKCTNHNKVCNSSKTDGGDTFKRDVKPVILELHPLDILALKLF